VKGLISEGNEEGPSITSKPRRVKNGLCSLAALRCAFSGSGISQSLYSNSFTSTLHARLA